MAQVFYGPDALPLTIPTVKAQRKFKAMTPTITTRYNHTLASFFFVIRQLIPGKWTSNRIK